MRRAIAREVIRFCLLMIAVSIVTFALVAASPIDPVQANIGQQALLGMSAERRAELVAYWGADTPMWERYLSWLGGVAHGDWGTSLRFNAPVVEVVGTRFLNSAALMAMAWVLSGALGFALGVVSGAREGSFTDRIIHGACIVFASTPAFWLALVALMVCSVYLGWFPLGFSVPIGAAADSISLLTRLHHMMLPALVLAVTGISNSALQTREKMIETLASPYARFSRARGESVRTFALRHAVRNVAIPALTLQFASVSEIFGGSVLVEQVFSYPGLGQAAITAGLGGDAPLLVGIALASAAFVFAGNAVANLLYRVVDPRLRIQERRCA